MALSNDQIWIVDRLSDAGVNRIQATRRIRSLGNINDRHQVALRLLREFAGTGLTLTAQGRTFLEGEPPTLSPSLSTAEKKAWMVWHLVQYGADYVGAQRRVHGTPDAALKIASNEEVVRIVDSILADFVQHGMSLTPAGADFVSGRVGATGGTAERIVEVTKKGGSVTINNQTAKTTSTSSSAGIPGWILVAGVVVLVLVAAVAVWRSS